MLKTYLKRLFYAIINKDLDETDYWDLDYTICKQLLYFIDDCGKMFRPFNYSESQRCNMLDEVRVYLDQIVNQTKEF
jgi:hypothetical protein